MKYAFQAKCDKDMINDPEGFLLFLKTYSSRISGYHKGYLRIPLNRTISYNGDDFVKNLVTVHHTYNQFKVPRIINHDKRRNTRRNRETKSRIRRFNISQG